MSQMTRRGPTRQERNLHGGPGAVTMHDDMGDTQAAYGGTVTVVRSPGQFAPDQDAHAPIDPASYQSIYADTGECILPYPHPPLRPNSGMRNVALVLRTSVKSAASLSSKTSLEVDVNTASIREKLGSRFLVTKIVVESAQFPKNLPPVRFRLVSTRAANARDKSTKTVDWLNDHSISACDEVGAGSSSRSGVSFLKGDDAHGTVAYELPEALLNDHEWRAVVQMDTLDAIAVVKKKAGHGSNTTSLHVPPANEVARFDPKQEDHRAAALLLHHTQTVVAGVSHDRSIHYDHSDAIGQDGRLTMSLPLAVSSLQAIRDRVGSDNCEMRLGDGTRMKLIITPDCSESSWNRAIPSGIDAAVHSIPSVMIFGIKLRVHGVPLP